MTPHAPVSDHADPTVPDGSDFPPAPLSRPCHRQLQGQSSRGSGDELVHPQDTQMRGDEPPESGVRLWPLLFISVTRLFPAPCSMLHKWFECLGAGTLLEVPGCLCRLRLHIGRLCGLLLLAKVAEATLTPLETFSFYFTLSLLLSFSLSASQ